MNDFPLSTEITANGTFVIRQQISLGNGDDFMQIEMSTEQAKRLHKEIDGHLAKDKVRDIKASLGTEHFDEFWGAYPAHRRINKAGARRKWAQSNLDAIGPQIIEHVRKMAMSEDWTKEKGQYCPLISTYLNQSRWEAAAEGTPTFTPLSV